MSFKIRDGKLQHIFCIRPLLDKDIPWWYMEEITHWLYNLSSWWTYDLADNRYIVILEGSVCSIIIFRKLLTDNFDLKLEEY